MRRNRTSQCSSVWGAVRRPVGDVIMCVGGAMVLSGAAGLASAFFSNNGISPDEHRQAIALGVAAVATSTAGALFRWFGPKQGTRRDPTSTKSLNNTSTSLSRREAILAVAVIWITAGLFGSIPYMLAAHMSPIDSIFEAFSGFTTTGATVIQNIETTLRRPMLLWRSVTQWLGGMGIVVLFVAVFPNVGVGAKILFRGEAPGTVVEKLQPRVADTSSFLWRAYVTLTIALVALLWALGMTPFEAICHAMTAMSTGGFSTRNNSIGAFNSPAIESSIAAFTLLSSINFGLYYAAISGRSVHRLLRSTELRVFVIFAVVSIILATASTAQIYGSIPNALRHSSFTVVSIITSTGFAIDSTANYPPLAIMVIMLLMIVGGCSRSTSGGIKVERVVLLAKMALAEVRSTFRPNVVQVIRMDGRRVHSAVLSDIAAYTVIYAACLAVCALALSAIDNLSVPVSFNASISCLSNMGPLPLLTSVDAGGSEVADGFASFSAAGKLLCSLAMVLGRLEFFTILALFIPDFWKR